MLRLAFLNLKRRKLRIFLLALTVVIATSFLVAIMILGNSLLEAVKTTSDRELLSEIFSAEFVKVIRNTLLAFNILALFIGAFVIKNTFTVILAQRAKELALMRAIGTSKAQIFKLVVWEALIIGLIGGIVGILIGTGLAQAFLSLAQALDWEIPNVGLRFSALVFILPVILGILVTTFSALLPAFKASRQSPLKALTGVEQLIKNVYTARLIIGSIVSALGLLIALIIIFTGLAPYDDPVTTGYILTLRIVVLFIGLSLLFVGFTILAPIIAKFFASLSMRFLKGSRFVGWRLSAGNVWRQPLRSATTANVLMIGITLITTVTVILGSFRATFIYFVEEFFPADWAIQAQPEKFEFRSDNLIEGSVYTQIKNINEEIEVVGLRYDYDRIILNDEVGVDASDETKLSTGEPESVEPEPLESRNQNYNLAGLDPADRAGDYFSLDLEEDEIINLRAGQVIVKLHLLEEQGLQVGEEIALSYLDEENLIPDTDRHKQTLIIGGSFDRYFDNMDFIVSNDVYEQLIQETNYAHLVVKNLSRTSDEEVRSSIETILASDDNLEIYGQDDIVEAINNAFAWILNIFRGLLSLSFLVAIAGIFNTLILSVFERTKEIGLLRAVGASTKLVRRMITIEAVQIATLGVVMGTLLGSFFAWGIVETTIQDTLAASPPGDGDIAIQFVFSIPFRELLLYYAIAIVLALIAAFGPALKATRLKIIEALTAK